MGKNMEFKEHLLEDSETEKLLKNFLGKMNMLMGEEYTTALLSTDLDIVKSLNSFTTKFEGKNSIEIAFILIRSGILSNDSSPLIEDLKSKIAFGEFQDVYDLVTMNFAYRKCLTKSLIRQSNSTDKELYDRLKDQDCVIETLDNLKFFEQIQKEKVHAYLKLKSN